MPCDSCEKLARLAEDACVISCCNSRFMDLYGGGGRGHNTSQNNFLICFVSGLEFKWNFLWLNYPWQPKATFGVTICQWMSKADHHVNLDMRDTLARAQAPPWEVGCTGLFLEVARWHRQLSGCCWGVGAVSSWSHVPSDTRHTMCNRWPYSSHHTQNPGKGREEKGGEEGTMKNVMYKNQRSLNRRHRIFSHLHCKWNYQYHKRMTY